MGSSFISRLVLALFIFLHVFFSHDISDAKEDTAHLRFSKSAVSSATNTFTYIVKKGDHLLDIMKNELGITKNRYSIIKKFNPQIKNLNLIHPGQKLILPTKTYRGRSQIVSDGIVATHEPDLKKGVIQRGARLPSITRLSLMQAILKRMNSTMVTSGRHVIPIPEIGQISVDCEMIPVIEFDDGSVVFLDFKKQMPENIKRLIRKYWTNYAVISANAQDNILVSLAKAIQVSNSYAMRKQSGPYTLGKMPSVRFPVDWIISGKPSSSKAAYFQALTAIKTEDRRLPQSMTTYLEKNRMIISEMLGESILPPWPDPPAGMSAPSPLPRLSSRSNRDLVRDTLVLLELHPVMDKDVQLFDVVRDGFNLAIKADIEVQNGNKRIIYTSKQLPKQFIDILQAKATDIIMLPAGDGRRATIEKTLSNFGVPYTTVPYMFPVSEDPALKEVKILFPTIRFVTSKGVTFYLIDFEMDASLYTLLHDTMGFNIVRY
jgi:hypothetical protein